MENNKKTGRFESKYTFDKSILIDDSPMKYWMLGLLASDGNIRKNTFSISQSGNRGSDIINYIKGKLNYTGVIYEYKTNSGKISYGLTVSSKEVVNYLQRYNIIENKTNIFKFPDIQTEYINSFIRGYFEGDGSVGVYDNGSGIEYIQCSIFGTTDTIESIDSNITAKGNIQEKTEIFSEVRYNGHNAVDFFNQIYSNKNLYLGRKFSIFKKYCDGDFKNTVYYDTQKRLIEIQKLLDLGKSPCYIGKYSNIDVRATTIYGWIEKGKLNYDKRRN